jgi:ribose transport system substrate-binding protein
MEDKQVGQQRRPAYERKRATVQTTTETLTFQRRETMRQRYLVTALIVGALALAGLAGAASAGRTASHKTITIGFAQRAFNNPWWVVQNSGVQAEAKKFGVHLLMADGGNDPVKQNSEIQNFIAQHVDAVIMNATDPRGVAPSLAALKRAHIPLVVVNSGLDPSLAGQQYCYVSENQVTNAAKDGKAMAEYLKKKYGSNVTLKAMMIGGFPTDLDTILRTKGIKQGYASVSGAPKLKFAPFVYGHWVSDQALAPIREEATANPDLKVVFLESDVMMSAAQSALKTLGLWNKVALTTYDGDMGTVKLMKENPSGPIIADAANVPYQQGTIGVDKAVDAVKGVPQSKSCRGGVDYLPTPLYTPQNAAKFYISTREY